MDDKELWKILDAEILKTKGVTDWCRQNKILGQRGAVNDMWNERRSISNTIAKKLGYRLRKDRWEIDN